MDGRNDQANRKGFGIDFIDPFFAVAVNVGFAEGLASREWFRDGRLPIGDEWFPLLVFLLGFVTLVWSWIGYHQSIADKPLRGLLRFFLDVVLVGLYALILLQADHLAPVLIMLAIVYALFIFWDIGKMQEYPDMYESRKPWSKSNRREQVTVDFFFVFAGLASLYSLNLIGRRLALALAFVLTGTYRLWKFEPLWRWHKIPWKDLAFGPHTRS